LDNPGEERPGGGVIGAVGEVTLAQGAVTSKLFRSSDFANSLVTGISAPAPLDQTLFHGKPWELSDSNWSPDFPTAAAQAARFYQAATGESVDGVIGVDPVALGYVLAVTGPVSVPPYPQTVDAQNALLELNEIINKARPGDPGKVYLAPFGDAVTTRVLSAPLGEDPDIAAALLRAAQGKHLVLDFNDPTLMAAADGAGFTGRISDPLSDMLQVVDANVGANKADLFVTRSYSLDATVSDNGEVADTLTLTYHNPAQTDPALQSLVSQFGGAYHDYVRAYVPESASLQSMKVQAGSGPVTSVSPSSIDYELQREAIGFLLVVPPGQTVTLTLTYAGPFADASSQPVQYAMSWGKEIGAPAWPVQLTVHIDGRQQAFSTTLDGDRTWSLSG
ncbi:MAG: DUF4012 domain-containing protein, partial [Candidatus Dormibacteraeota bacterium]|nr:DUF4012 domain-containing protein [Candidatus Dormibacteraeota bacterium]